jgi:hypothetical protein
MRAPIAALALLAACPVGDDDDSAANSWAPTIDESFPAPSTQTLPQDGSLEFAARGGDVDSLDLQFAWTLDGAFQAGGSSDDGTFDTAYTLSWDEDWSGARVEVGFEVDDGEFVESLTWPVDVE